MRDSGSRWCIVKTAIIFLTPFYFYCVIYEIEVGLDNIMNLNVYVKGTLKASFW